MKRISTYMPSRDMQYHLRLREWKMNQLNNRMATQSKINNLRDDPIAASRSVRFQSQLARLKQYTENVETIRGKNAFTEGYLREAVDIIHRIRELAVQGANGIYTKQDLAYMGEEVDQHLKELLHIANARYGDGTTLFSGYRTNIDPFRISKGRMDSVERVVKVDYIGNIGRNLGEISEAAFADANIPGNYVFWAENQHIYANLDATSYQVQEDSVIRIDGVNIELKAGDNISAIISRINESAAPVLAQLDPVTNSLYLKTTVPHEMWLQDAGAGTVLRDLGMLKEAGGIPPANISNDALASGASVFDLMIFVRDRFLEGDTEQIGGAVLGSIDIAMDNLLTHVARLGAEDRRLEVTENRLHYEQPVVIEQNSKEVDLDLSEAITELKMLEYTHKAALQTTARIMEPTLLDYLR
ncbi:MAG: flagellar hook-associated protein 3 [Spirochaetales bacterium]|nr:flagellar hook-associated protein 3 [Spirochaetales bacterium]